MLTLKHKHAHINNNNMKLEYFHLLSIIPDKTLGTYLHNRIKESLNKN